MQIDIGFGDVVTPSAIEIKYPTLLEFPAPVLLAYPKGNSHCRKIGGSDRPWNPEQSKEGAGELVRQL
jgi:hypothetical protein